MNETKVGIVNFFQSEFLFYFTKKMNFLFPQEQRPDIQPRLFQCSNASGKFWVEEIFDFDQDVRKYSYLKLSPYLKLSQPYLNYPLCQTSFHLDFYILNQNLTYLKIRCRLKGFFYFY